MTVKRSASFASACSGWLSVVLLCAACRTQQGAPTYAKNVSEPSQRIACGAFAPLTPGRPWVSNTAQGIDAMHGRCVRGGAPSCVFTLDVPSRAQVRLRLESIDFDPALAILAGPRERPVDIACVDDAPVGDLRHARVEATLGPGRYWVVVESAAGETGTFELFAEVDPLPPPELVCDTARKLAEGLLVRESTQGGINEFSATCAGGAEGPDHVYRLDVPEASRVRLRLTGEYDGSLSLRSACLDPASELACNDDGTVPGESLLTASVKPGSYYAIVDSFSAGQSGEYTLLYERALEPAPRTREEVCDEVEALAIAPGYYEVDTLYDAALMEGSCGGAGAPERALHFVVERPSALHVSLVRPEFDAALYLLRNCRDETSELTCVEVPFLGRLERGADVPPRELITELEPGAYTLVVDGLEASNMGATGVNFDLRPLADPKAKARRRGGALRAPRAP